jgi:cell division protein FtsQ
VRSAPAAGERGQTPYAAARALAALLVAARRLAPRRVTLPRVGRTARRRLLVALAVLVVLFAGYRLWLRDSALVGVERVSVTGLTTKDAGRLRAALASTARTMTTLHVERERLERVVAGYPVVSSLDVTTDFPHGMRIRVVEHRPAAIAVTGGGRVPVAIDGTVLQGLPVEGRLPVVQAPGGLRGQRLADPRALAAAHVAGAAPAALRGRVQEVGREGERGLVAKLRDGPDLIFGAAAHARAKWLAAARVLADPEAEGASYVDLRVPGRPAVGGLGFESAVPAAPVPPPVATAPATNAEPATATPAPEAEAAGAAAAAPVPAPTPAEPQTPATPAAPGSATGGTAAAPAP